MRRIAVLDAPSNLGLRPPTATSVPGCAKAPGALRDQGLLTRLGARDAGCLTPPRYDAGDWRPGDGVAHAPQIAAYSLALADRIGAILDAGEFPVILGGDCSILLGSGIAMHRLGRAIDGHIGLVFVDGHSDFRHPGNASYVGAAAGEDLALVTGRGQSDLTGIEGRRPYFRDVDVVVLGIRAQDEHRLDLQAAGIVTRPVPALRAEGAARSAQWAREQLTDCAGYWVHVDVDVLDPAVMPAVDAPSPGGIAFPELELLLAGLVESPHCLGVEITVFDPDYDPDGSYAAEITSAVTAGLAAAHHAALRPDLAAARRDMDSADGGDTEAARRRRRAKAAAESVSLAAEGASGADSSTPDEPALPATTLLAVEDGAEVPAAHTPHPGAADRHPGAADRHPGAADRHPGAADRHPGAADRHPGAADRHPGAADSHPGAADSHPGAADSHPGAADSHAGAGDGLPGVADGVSGAANGKSAPVDLASAAATDRVPTKQPAGPDSATGDSAVDTDVSKATDESGASVAEDQPMDDPATEGAAEQDRRVGPVRGERTPHTVGSSADHVAAAVRLLSRPLGSAPLLDSAPLPATRPGMLRPRRTAPADDPPDTTAPRTAKGVTLPTQRPAVDAGSGEPADIG